MNSKEFVNSKVIKRFSGGNQSLKVELLENNIVVKHFDSKQVHKYDLEKANLIHLQTCPFVPHLVAYDDANKRLYMTYCGECPKRYTRQLKTLVRDRLQSLQKDFRMTRRYLNSSGKWLPAIKNVTIDSQGRVFLIDLGSPWHLDEKHVI